jgi:hypothetical protein
MHAEKSRRRLWVALIALGLLIPVCYVTLELLMRNPGGPPAMATPSPIPISGTLGERTRQALDTLSQGQVVYNKPDEMWVGEAAQIQALLIADAGGEATERLKAYLVESGTPLSQTLRVSALMKVRLVPQDRRDFDIERLHSDDVQAIGSLEPTSWSWRVIPLRSGTRVLYLRATAMIELPGEPMQTRDLPSQTISIPVKVNPAYSVWQTVMRYWWVLVSIALVVLGAVGLRKGYLRPKPEPRSPVDQLAEARENLRLIQERKSQYVMETDIPLQLIKEERRLLERIEELEQLIDTSLE